MDIAPCGSIVLNYSKLLATLYFSFLCYWVTNLLFSTCNQAFLVLSVIDLPTDYFLSVLFPS